MSDRTLQIAVMKALGESPVVRADEIAADVHDGDVVLRGTVGTLVQKAEATRVTRTVPGVRRVDDQLGVHPMGVDGRAKADTEAAVLDALIADERVHAGDIEVNVHDDGAVTLNGIVEHADQRDAAERIALAVPGVESVHNELGVLVQVSADDVAERVTGALGIEGVVGAEHISVRVRDTNVTLTGTVHSHAHHDAAITAAASASGVTSVLDELNIEERC